MIAHIPCLLQFLRISGKRKRGQEDIKIIDANVDDYVDPGDLMKGISEESSYQPHRKKDNMPSQQQKRKKQITYLAFQVMMRMPVELVVVMIMASSVIVMIFRHLCSRLVCIFSVWLVANVHHMLIVCFVWKVLCEHVFWMSSRYTVSSKTKILYFSVSITIC